MSQIYGNFCYTKLTRSLLPNVSPSLLPDISPSYYFKLVRHLLYIFVMPKIQIIANYWDLLTNSHCRLLMPGRSTQIQTVTQWQTQHTHNHSNSHKNKQSLTRTHTKKRLTHTSYLPTKHTWRMRLGPGWQELPHARLYQPHKGS